MPGSTEVQIISAGSLGEGRSKRLTLTVGTSVYTVTPPGGDWGYLKVTNLTADTVLSVAINENPAAAPAANPGVAADWEPGYDIPGGASELMALADGTATIRLLSDTVGTEVVLNLVR